METTPLDAWLAEKQEALNKFATYWRSLSYDHPNTFPRELPVGDWEEQFDFFKEEI